MQYNEMIADDEQYLLSNRDWTEFNGRIRDYLVFSGHDDILQGEQSPSDSVERKEWDTHERRGCTISRSKLSTLDYSLLQTENSHCKLLETLERNWQTQCTGMTFSLCQQFVSIRLEHYRNVTEYAEAFQKKSQWTWTNSRFTTAM